MKSGAHADLARGLADKIIAYRGRHDMSQEEFGKLANLSKQTVSEIERGRLNLTRFTIAKIEHVLEEEK